MNTAGIDIGGTQLRVGIFDEQHQLLESFRTENDRSLNAAENMKPLIRFLDARKQDLRAVGIGCPGPLSVRDGKMLNPPNLVGWDQFEIVRHVHERIGCHVELSNDASVACLAEAKLGAGKNYESVAYVGLSTGVGGGFVIHGKIYNGAHSNAAEFWNMIVNEDPRCHKNANPGSLNEQASGSGLARAATEGYGRSMTARALFERFECGDPLAVTLVKNAADALARGIANISCTLDPEVIVIGGSVAIFNPVYVQMAVEQAKKYCIFPNELRVLPAVFGDDAGLLGASLLCEA